MLRNQNEHFGASLGYIHQNPVSTISLHPPPTKAKPHFLARRSSGPDAAAWGLVSAMGEGAPSMQEVLGSNASSTIKNNQRAVWEESLGSLPKCRSGFNLEFLVQLECKETQELGIWTLGEISRGF